MAIFDGIAHFSWAFTTLGWANEGKPIGNMKIMIVIMTDVAFDFCTRMHDPWIMCK